MIKIYLKRGAGKTTKLIKMAVRDSKAVILVPTKNQKDYYIKLFYTFGGKVTDIKAFRGVDVITVSELSKLQGMKDYHLYIDNVEGVLQQLLNYKVTAITLTKGE